MSCNCNRRCRCEKPQWDDVVISPTEKIVNKRTKHRVVKHIHPTEVINVNREIIRNEHFYPITEREVHETLEENYNCGRNINNHRRYRGNG